MRSVPLLSTIRQAPPRKRLWLAGVGLGLFLLTFVVGNGVIRRDRAVTRADLGHDFLAFYVGAAFVHDGRYRDLYDLEAVRRAEAETARAAGIDLGNAFGPWWNPPFYALALSPLARLPYATALDVWRWINLGALVAAAVVLGRMTRPSPSSRRACPPLSPGEVNGPQAGRLNGVLTLLLLATSMPFIQAIGHAQNTPTSLLLLSVTVTLWRAERAVWAGIVSGLLFYKPQLAAVVAGVMVLDLGWAALAGLAITGVALLLVTTIALPGSLGDWLHKLPANVRFMQVEHPYLWDRHVTIKSFWRLLLQGTAAGEETTMTTLLAAVSWVAVAGPLAWVAIRARRREERTEPRRRDVAKEDAKKKLAAELAQPMPAAGGIRWRARNLFALIFAPSRLRGSNLHLRAAQRRDRLIAATVCAMPLLMPFYFDYDLLLLAVPATLYAADRSRDRSLTIAWVALYGWMFVNAPIASRFHVAGAVVGLAVVTAMSIRRVNRPVTESRAVPLTLPLPLAAAA